MSDDRYRKLNEAIAGLFREGEMVVGWCLVTDIAGRDDTRYLAHRYGGGIDGDDSPMSWTALGMLRASMQLAEQQMLDAAQDVSDDE